MLYMSSKNESIWTLSFLSDVMVIKEIIRMICSGLKSAVIKINSYFRQSLKMSSKTILKFSYINAPYQNI